jgi:hypothetical protein
MIVLDYGSCFSLGGVVAIDRQHPVFRSNRDRGRSSRETLGGLPSTANNMRSQAGDDVDLVDRQIYPRLTRESVNVAKIIEGHCDGRNRRAAAPTLT